MGAECSADSVDRSTEDTYDDPSPRGAAGGGYVAAGGYNGGVQQHAVVQDGELARLRRRPLALSGVAMVASGSATNSPSRSLASRSRGSPSRSLASPSRSLASPSKSLASGSPSRGISFFMDPELEGYEGALCRFCCNRPVARGLSNRGNAFDTCCRACAVNKGDGVHDPCCGKDASQLARPRDACQSGSRCRDRSAAHLEAMAHPLDLDYYDCCTRGTRPIREPEKISLKVVFDWTDADGSGKLSRGELEAIVSTLEQHAPGKMPPITEAAWKALDEDGNGCVNFVEFASWAGERLGFPLGVNKMMRRMGSADACRAPPCSLVCPCEGFVMSAGKSRAPKASDKCKTCGHKFSVHHFKTNADSDCCPTCDGRGEFAGSQCPSCHGHGKREVEYPYYWTHSDGKVKHAYIELMGDQLAEFQALLNATYKGTWTRDRSRHNPTLPKVPLGFKVKRVKRNENAANWREYACRRAEMILRLEERKRDGEADWPTWNTKTMDAWNTVGGSKADRLLPEINEWYLFHGSAPEIADKICQSDFQIGSTAGKNTGTLYGKGLYFAESITKADEYAKIGREQLYAVMLCRVIGGNVKYCDTAEPDPEDLVASCISGPFDSVLGDREKLRGTYREFVIFDSEDVFPEYIIEYAREY